MKMSWIALSFLAAVLWSSVILFDKFVVDNEIEDPLIDVSINGVGLHGTLMVAGAVFGTVSFSPEAVLGGILVGAFYIMSIATYYRGMQTEEVSRFAPMISLSTIFVAILSFLFLGESFNTITYVGIILAVLGTFLISLEDPLHNLKKLQSKKGFLLGIAVAVLFSFREVSFGYFSNEVSFLNLIFWTGVSGLALSLFLIGYKRKEIHSSRGTYHLGFIGFIAALGFLSFMRAVSTGPVSLSSAIVRTQPMFVFFGSVIITFFYPEALSENIDRFVLVQKLLAVTVAVVGIVLITLF